MGLSAFQHLTFLDAKIDDLEAAAQTNSRKMLNLQQQLEKISTDYEDVTSNRQMKIQLYYSGTAEVADAKVARTQNLTYATLMSGTWASCTSAQSGVAVPGDVPEYTSNSFYRLKSVDGAIVVADKSEIPGYSDSMPKAGNRYTKTTTTKIDGKTVTEKQVYIVDPALTFGTSTSGGTVDAPNYLQDCMRNGKYLLEKGAKNTEKDEFEWHSLSWDSTSNILDSYYTDDDEAAKAKYDRESNQISAQEKKLELEQDNIETQRQKATKDRESAEKVIEDNVEKTFGIFA